MPRIRTFANSAIYIYAAPAEHPPPHFHIVGPDLNVRVLIQGIVPVEGQYRSKDIGEALRWAAANVEELMEKWELSMAETDRVTVGRALPKIAAVAALPPTSVAVTWDSGVRGGCTEVIDLAPMLLSLKLYKPLRENPGAFRKVRVAAFGYAIAWDDDDEIDMSSIALEELAEQTMGAMDFKDFMKRQGFTLDAAAAQLGLGRRIVAYYAAGERPIPRTVALACGYLDRLMAKTEPSAAAG